MDQRFAVRGSELKILRKNFHFSAYESRKAVRVTQRKATSEMGFDPVYPSKGVRI